MRASVPAKLAVGQRTVVEKPDEKGRETSQDGGGLNGDRRRHLRLVFGIGFLLPSIWRQTATRKSVASCCQFTISYHAFSFASGRNLSRENDFY
jgi:hypothetical protein